MSLRDHYLRTTYRVSGVTPAIDIRVGEPCPPLDALLDKHAARSWAFITAWNPGSKKLEADENHRRQAALKAEVKQDGYVFYRGAGIPDDQVEQSSGETDPDTLHRVGRSPARTCAGTLFETPAHSFHVPRSSLDSWEPEESILILGIDSEDAVKLGKKYAQAAIVFGERNGLAQLVFNI